MRQLGLASTLENQDISSALLVCTYTADADRSIFFRLFADQVAGNGDYVAYLTIQRLGAGSAYQVVPITTAAVANGVTAIAMPTIAIPVNDTDVVKVYLTGLPADDTTPDIITEVWEGVDADWEDGGRLDELLDAIPTTAMRGTDGANTTKTGYSLASDGLDLVTVWTVDITGTISTVTDVTNDVTTDADSRTASKANVSALALVVNQATIAAAIAAIPTTKTGYALTEAERNSVADAYIQRDVDNVEGTMPEHCIGTVILAMLESSISGTTWTIKRTDGSTTHATKTVTVDADASPITGVT